MLLLFVNECFRASCNQKSFLSLKARNIPKAKTPFLLAKPARPLWCVLALGCGPHYEFAIEEFCLAKFRLDMQELDQRHWCSWEDTVELYGELTNCTSLVAHKMDCFWPNRLVDEFFIRVHKHYFHNCSLSGRQLKDPPNRILGPFIVVPILVTLLMTALVVWRSKRSEGIV
uniref:Receptor activity-modifying protein 1 n=1 Tax=Cyclopterus lumpus TaxID=8103 RepID=A0A8C3A7T8_CYCLU